MRYTIEGLDQAQLVAWKLDATDAVLIRWFADFYHGATMTKVEHEGKEYGWLKYQHAINELPCVGIANKKVLSRRFAKYIACGLMKIHVKKSNKGTFSCYHIVPEEWDALTSKADGDSAGYSKVPCAGDLKVPSAGYSKVQPKDSSSIDSAATAAQPQAPPSEPSPRKQKDGRSEKSPKVSRPPAPDVRPDFETKQWIGVTAELFEHWEWCYPAVDIELEMRSALDFAYSHPEKQYTKWLVYLTGWFRRTQQRRGAA